MSTTKPQSTTEPMDRLRAALENIASQRLRIEIEPIDGEISGDFEGAYDIMINVARDALAASAAPVVDGISWSALLAVLERLKSKTRNPEAEWYHGWHDGRGSDC